MKINSLFSLVIFLLIAIAIMQKAHSQNYDESLVDVSTFTSGDYSFQSIYMNIGASGNRIKAKYFASKDFDGTTVPERYNAWSAGKNIISVASGTYMTGWELNNSLPVGLTIDNGRLVNSNLAEFDGLVIVYPTGRIEATDLEDGNLRVQGGDLSGIDLNLRGNPYHLGQFKKWCENNDATVFQTHLLVYNNELKIYKNAVTDSRERRFLAIGYDENSNIIHCIVNLPQSTTLLDGSIAALRYLKDYKEMEVSWMINLDTGSQNVFDLYDNSGNKNPVIHGITPIDLSINLLVYYYQ